MSLPQHGTMTVETIGARGGKGGNGGDAEPPLAAPLAVLVEREEGHCYLHRGDGRQISRSTSVGLAKMASMGTRRNSVDTEAAAADQL